MAAFGVPLTHEDDAERARARGARDRPRGRGARARGADRRRVGRGRRRGRRVDVRDRRGGEPRRAPAAGGGAGRDPARPCGAAGSRPARSRSRTRARSRSRAAREPIWTWRAFAPTTASRRVAAPFVGREQELELLENSFARAVRDRRAQLVTVFGEPGHRQDAARHGVHRRALERVTTLSGRTLPYGEGVTYWPLASMIKASAGITDDDPANEAFEKLRLCCESEAVADLLAVALGVLGAAEGEQHRGRADLGGTALGRAARRRAAARARLRGRPLGGGAAARPDRAPRALAPRRPGADRRASPGRSCSMTGPSWGGGIRSASAIELAPLDASESRGARGCPARAVPMSRPRSARSCSSGPRATRSSSRRSRACCSATDGGARAHPRHRAGADRRADRRARRRREARPPARRAVGRVFWRGALDALAPDLDVAALLDRLARARVRRAGGALDDLRAIARSGSSTC